MRTGYLIAASVVLHVGAFAMVTRKAKEIEKKQTLIEVVDQQKKEEEKKNEPPPKPIEAAAEVLAPKQLAPSPAPAAEPVVNQAPSTAMQALPEVGAQASGAGGTGTAPGGDGTGGGGSGTGGGGAGKPVEKVLGNPSSNAAKDPDLAEEIAAWKPKPTARVKPVYPDEARSSEIEGTVVVEVTIECTGKVGHARVAKGLGHGLDEAALTAVRKTEFAPAPRCAPGFQKSMKINYAFRLGD